MPKRLKGSRHKILKKITMKKLLTSALTLCAVLMMQSCYTTSTYVGNAKPSTPMVKVQTVHNSHYIGGLIGTPKMRAKDMVEGEQDYMVKHQITFLDYVLSGVTLGIYTPSTTTYYVPVKSGNKNSSKKKGKWDDDDDED